jgi:hypothetical protein
MAVWVRSHHAWLIWQTAGQQSRLFDIRFSVSELQERVVDQLPYSVVLYSVVFQFLIQVHAELVSTSFVTLVCYQQCAWHCASDC